MEIAIGSLRLERGVLVVEPVLRVLVDGAISCCEQRTFGVNDGGILKLTLTETSIAMAVRPTCANYSFRK